MKKPPTQRDYRAGENFLAAAFERPESQRVVHAPSVKREGPSEHQEQCALIQWWRYECKLHGLPEFSLFAIPNGGQRNVIAGARLKAEGMRRGIPDLMLAVPRNNWHGLFLELKVAGNYPTAEQKEAMAFLIEQQYRAVLCYGAGEAISTIKEYLK